MSVRTVASRNWEPNSGWTRRLLRPIQPNPASRATFLCEIEGCRAVVDIGEHCIQDPLAEGDAPMETGSELLFEQEFSPNRGDIGDAEKPDPDVERELSQGFLRLGHVFHGYIVATRGLGCQRGLTLPPDWDISDREFRRQRSGHDRKNPGHNQARCRQEEGG